MLNGAIEGRITKESTRACTPRDSSPLSGLQKVGIVPYEILPEFVSRGKPWVEARCLTPKCRPGISESHS